MMRKLRRSRCLKVLARIMLGRRVEPVVMVQRRIELQDWAMKETSRHSRSPIFLWLLMFFRNNYGRIANGGGILCLGDEAIVILPPLYPCITFEPIIMDTLYLPQRTGHVLLVDAWGR
uniref:Uncharacterized protein n=1 Tax=Helianthus annuus TaxID=4232 RepID=A0A251S2P3_HELAN